jgi:hypothetical protein
MTTPGIFSNTSQNAKLFATFVVGSAALIAGKKGIMWAGNKAYNMAAYCGSGIMSAGKWAENTLIDGVHFALKDGGIAGPTSTGILAGTAIGLTYKYSAIAASHQFPIKSPGHQVGNRSIVMATSVFALTLLAVRYSNSKFSSHQMSLAGAISYASIATIASLFTVAITSDGDHSPYNRADRFSDYPERLVELLSASFTSDTSRFWAGKHSQQPVADYISNKIGRGRLSSENANRIAQAIENSQYQGQALTILNELLTGYEQNPDDIAMIFMQLPDRRQGTLRGGLEETIQHRLPPTVADSVLFWQNLEGSAVERIFEELPRGQYERLEEGQTQRLAFFIENYQGGREIATILNALQETHEVNPTMVVALFNELSEAKQRQVKGELNETLQQWLSFDRGDRGFDMQEQEYDVRQSMHAHTDAFTWNESAKMGICAGLASGVVSAVAYLGVKSIFAFGDAFPMVKGSVPAAILVAPAYMLAKGELSKEKHNLRKKQQKLYSMAIATILGAALTPKLSSYMLKKKVGYLASAGYSLAPIVAMFLMKHANGFGSGSSRRTVRREYEEEQQY